MAGTSLLDTIFRRRKKKTTEFITDSAVFEFEFDTIRAVTNEFSDLDLVGHGGFSSVFKGRLQSGQEIAVKRLSESSNGTERHFHNELNLMSKLRHKNLINLLGFCTKRDQHCLVYEFMPNLSLDRFIFDPQRASELNWEICRNIGIARGLRYLHDESGLWVLHRDINPTNILLDSDLKPKIAGFGFARMMQQGENEAESTVIAGTPGYLDPEYFHSGRLSIKSDVYAFGVTILTIISRKRAITHSGEGILIKNVMRLWNRGEAINVIHEVMRAEEREDSISEILRYIHIALLCIDDNSETRPSLDKVLHWFSCFSTPLPEPTIGNRFLAEEETSSFLAEEETNRFLAEEETSSFLAEEETNWSLSPSLSLGHSSITSPVS